MLAHKDPGFNYRSHCISRGIPFALLRELVRPGSSGEEVRRGLQPDPGAQGHFLTQISLYSCSLAVPPPPAAARLSLAVPVQLWGTEAQRKFVQPAVNAGQSQHSGQLGELWSCALGYAGAGASTRSNVHALVHWSGLIYPELSSETALGLTWGYFRSLSEQDFCLAVAPQVGAVHLERGREPGWGALGK